MLRKTSLLTILFPDKSRPKSVSLTEMLKKLEDEEVDLMEFLGEDADRLRVNSPRMQPSSFVQENRLEPETDPGIVFLRRSRSFSANAPDKFQMVQQRSFHLTSNTIMEVRSTDVEFETEEEMDSSDVRVRRAVKNSQAVPVLTRAHSQTMARPVSVHVMESTETKELVSTKSFSEPSSPATPDTGSPSQPEENSIPFPEAEITPQKTEREKVLEQRAALAEKKAKLLKQLKEQAEKDIKTRDFAFSVKDPRHWGGK